MKKLVALPFKLVAIPLLIITLIVLTVGSLIVNGKDKTSRNLATLNDAMAGLLK
jgi:hypothetical protein